VAYLCLALFFEQGGYEMKVWLDLFSTDYGLMSLIGIAMMVIAMVGFVYFVVKHLGK
jgi:hypothetical protein